MDYEKKYNEALQTARQWIQDGCTDREKVALENSFPELRPPVYTDWEKALANALYRGVGVVCMDGMLEVAREVKDQVLEAAKEEIGWQKPAEWSEEDEKIITALTKALIGSDSAEKIMLFDGVTIEMVSDWLKSLRPQPKQEWSEEDERIRKAIIGYIDHGQHYDVSNKDMIAWLEKQGGQNPEWNKKPCLTCQEYDNGYKQGYTEGYNKAVKEAEQKSAEWSKNDTIYLNEIIDFFENKTVKLQHDLDMYAHWLKSLPERFVLEPKQEWSEEDEKTLDCVINVLDRLGYEEFCKSSRDQDNEEERFYYKEIKCLKRLKSLRSQQHDLPSGFYFIDEDGHRYYSKEFRCKDLRLKVHGGKAMDAEDMQELLRKEYERGYKECFYENLAPPPTIPPYYPAPYPGYPVYQPDQWRITCTSDMKADDGQQAKTQDVTCTGTSK